MFGLAGRSCSCSPTLCSIGMVLVSVTTGMIVCDTIGGGTASIAANRPGRHLCHLSL